MSELVELWERPKARRIYMLAGWHQWADAGAVSSGLPAYQIDHLDARQIGRLKPDGFYLFQIPGTHHLLRPEVHFHEGYSKQIEPRRNDFFYAGNDDQGLVIFLGEEPHMNVDEYADALFHAAQELQVRRMAIVGGVYGAMPYDKDREVSCTYSLPHMKAELSSYAVRFSNYHGGATIGSYLVDRAEQYQLEVFVFNAFVPVYDFGQGASAPIHGVRIENDYRAWYELMRRFNHMFGLGIDLSDLDRRSEELTASIEAKVEELERTMPQLNVRAYLQKVASEFTERPFMPLDDVWEEGLSDLFEDLED